MKGTVQNTVPHSRTAGYEQTSRLLLWTRGEARRTHLTSAATAALTGSGPGLSPFSALEVRETSTLGDGVVEEELLGHFFLLKLGSALVIALSSRSQLGVRDQMAAMSEALLFRLKGMVCPGDGSKIANTIQLWLVQSKKE